MTKIQERCLFFFLLICLLGVMQNATWNNVRASYFNVNLLLDRVGLSS